MKAIRGMQRGVKQEPKLNKTEMIQSLDKELKNMQMAGRVTQMMVQQMMQNMQNLSKDLGKSFGIINELQYKILAMQSIGNFDMDVMAKKADELRLNDFIEASDAEDKAGNFTIGDKVQDDSTVIITSTTTSDDAGLFRSRIKLAECGVPALTQGLAGQGVGAKVACKLNGTDHVVELLAIRNPPPAAPVEPPAGDVMAVGDPYTADDGSVSQDYVRVPGNDTVN
mgnify:CR=1 FL=1